jgi:hypothetical protein
MLGSNEISIIYNSQQKMDFDVTIIDYHRKQKDQVGYQQVVLVSREIRKRHVIQYTNKRREGKNKE